MKMKMNYLLLTVCAPPTVKRPSFDLPSISPRTIHSARTLLSRLFSGGAIRERVLSFNQRNETELLHHLSLVPIAKAL